MSMLGKVIGFFWGKSISAAKSAAGSSRRTLSQRGLLIFEHTSEVIRAESLLKGAGLDVAVKGPPPEVRVGCDLAVEFPLILELQVSSILESGKIKPLRVVPIEDVLLEPVSLYQVKDFGEHLMVRAANMKITVNKSDLRIVNISGGGCPDVPYLADRLIGKTLLEASEPRSLGSTLCGCPLQLAYEETTLWNAIELCLSSPGVKDSSNKERHKQGFAHVLKWFGPDFLIKDLWIPQIKEYQIHRQGQKAAASTVNKEKASLSLLFQCLVENRLMD